MDTGLIDLKELGIYLKKRWLIILIVAILCGIIFNIYGVHKVRRNLEAAELRHTDYVKAAEELPGYYTETLYYLRSRLSDHQAEFVEAYANIYKSFLKEYGGEGELSTDNLEAYMMFLDSYKDVLSVMSGTQREYYELLLTVDTDHSAGEHPQVTSFDKATVSAIQPQWILFGFVAGTVISGVIGVILFTFPHAGKNVKK